MVSALGKKKKKERGVGAHEVLLFYVRLSRKASQRRCPFSEEKPADNEGGSYMPAEMGQVEPACIGPEV